MDMRWACLLLFLLLPIVCSQPGFVSIKCCATSNTTDNLTEIQWMSDSYLFGNVGRCRTVSVPSVADPVYKSARVFDTNLQSRWCHDLSVVQGQEYLLRATFLHGPMLRSFAETSFNISIGAISLSRINSSINFLEVEGIFAVSDSHTEICLLKEKGNAYISMVELRPLTDSIYLNGSSSTVLKLVSRIDLGNKHGTYRHPQDLADRIWRIDPYLNKSSTLTSLEAILHGANSSIPLEVLRTAKVDPKRLEFLHTDLDTTHDDYLIILFFLELSSDVETGERIFDIYVNGERKYERMDILEKVHASNYRQVPLRVRSNGYLNISLVKVSDTIKYGPICNAYEIFEVHHRAVETVQRDGNAYKKDVLVHEAPTFVGSGEVVAMAELKKELVAKNQGNLILQKWNGDPCLPSPWEGVLCKERNGTVVITKLDLSSKSFQGPIPTIIGNLTELEELDLQRNNFTGTVPDSFVSLPHLSKLSIGCNPYLNNKLPVGLSGRMDLTVDFESCSSQDPSKAEAGQIYVIGSIAGGSVAFSLVLGIFFTCCYKRARHPNKSDYPVIKNAVFSMSSINEAYLNPIVQSFTLQYIENATCNYKTMIGEGGFGPVYRGTLPNGQEIAVKVRSATSTQGTREFDNEVTFLSAIRHENLVPLLGYCCDNDQQILVYPFMSNGSLQDRLYGEGSRRKVLDWPTRLSIALGAARGITYLHNFAGRCIIHRDIKSSNILLDHSMCGKVADFGFSKYAPQEGDSGASLEVRGTAGYLDPEYYSTQQLSTKSDVFSFGVVLLEIVTGREPLNIHRPRNEWSLVEWAKPFFRESRIDEIVDPSIRGGYHAEAMWRVVETALTCLEPFSTYRPNMVDIVRELEDALIIENNASEYMRSIESMGDSRRHYYSMELKVLPTIPSPTEPSPNYCQIVAAPQPR